MKIKLDSNMKKLIYTNITLIILAVVSTMSNWEVISKEASIYIVIISLIIGPIFAYMVNLLVLTTAHYFTLSFFSLGFDFFQIFKINIKAFVFLPLQVVYNILITIVLSKSFPDVEKIYIVPVYFIIWGIMIHFSIKGLKKEYDQPIVCSAILAIVSYIVLSVISLL